MFGLFKKKEPPLGKQITDAVDEINRLWPLLPKGQTFWSEWKPTPHLVVIERIPHVQARNQLYP